MNWIQQALSGTLASAVYLEGGQKVRLTLRSAGLADTEMPGDAEPGTPEAQRRLEEAESVLMRFMTQVLAPCCPLRTPCTKNPVRS